MTATAARGPWTRAVAVLLLLAVLGGLFVAAGTDAPNPAANDYPSEDEVGPEPSEYVGQQVTLGGTVVSADPVRIEVEYGVGETFIVTIDGLDTQVSEGDQLTAFGTLTDESTLAAERVIVREPWELWYMYIVSFLAGVWVLARTGRRWRFDAEQRAFVPRDEPRSIRGERDA